MCGGRQDEVGMKGMWRSFMSIFSCYIRGWSMSVTRRDVKERLTTPGNRESRSNQLTVTVSDKFAPLACGLLARGVSVNGSRKQALRVQLYMRRLILLRGMSSLIIAVYFRSRDRITRCRGSVPDW